MMMDWKKYKENSDIKWMWSPGLEVGNIMMHKCLCIGLA